MPEVPILSILRLPARLTVSQTATLLGFEEYQISVLAVAGLLRPLGKPAQNGHKWFFSQEVRTLAQDRAWLDKATRLVAMHFRNKAGKRRAFKSNTNLLMVA